MKVSTSVGNKDTWLSATIRFLREKNYSFNTNEQTIDLPFGGEKASLRVLIVVDDGSMSEPGWIVFTAWLSILVRPEKRRQALEFFNSKNLQQAVGSFELRSMNGLPASVMFKIGYFLRPGMLSSDLIEYAIAAVIEKARSVEDESILLFV